MKKYESLISKAEQKVADLKAAGKGYSAQELSKRLQPLRVAISHNREKEADKAAEALKEFASEVEVPKVETQVKDSLTKKK